MLRAPFGRLRTGFETGPFVALLRDTENCRVPEESCAVPPKAGSRRARQFATLWTQLSTVFRKYGCVLPRRSLRAQRRYPFSSRRSQRSLRCIQFRHRIYETDHLVSEQPPAKGLARRRPGRPRAQPLGAGRALDHVEAGGAGARALHFLAHLGQARVAARAHLAVGTVDRAL